MIFLSTVCKRILIILSFCLISKVSVYPQKDWTNWGTNQRCVAKEILAPTTLLQMQEIFIKAATENAQIRAIGSGHSWSDLVCTDGYLINTDAFNKVLSIDKEKLQITVEAGIKIKDLIKILAQEGMALSNQGFITEQSIAGAIATATHGTGHTGTLSDFIIAVQLLDAQGVLHTVSETSNPDWLPAVRVHLGALGFVYSVTIQCEKLFVLNHRRALIPLNTFLQEYKEYYENNDHFMIMAHPNSDEVLGYFWNRTRQPISNNVLICAPENILMSNLAHQLGIISLSRFPKTANMCMKALLHALQQKDHREYSYITLSPLKCPVSVNYYIEEEIALPLESLGAAFEETRQLFSQYEESGTPIIGLITCRFSPGLCSSYLSPCFGRDTAYLTVNIINYFDEYENFFHAYERIMEKYNGRPHWGKFHYLDAEKVRNLYGESARKFNEVRKQLDPANRFANNFVLRCFENNPQNHNLLLQFESLTCLNT